MPLVDGWETIAEAEAALGLPARSLQETLDAYNAHAGRGDDPDFHKHPDWLRPLDHPPYAAFDASVGRGVYVGFTVGGLRVSLDGEVLTEEGDAIPACSRRARARRTSCSDSAGYCSGICLGEAAYFGRRGRNARRRPRQPDSRRGRSSRRVCMTSSTLPSGSDTIALDRAGP